MRIFELRKNPESNPKINPVKKLIELSKQHDNLFVSMTTVDKLGINPQSKYDTPIGIYSYPVSYVISKTRTSDNFGNLPFAGKAPYINIFTLSNVLNIDDMTASDVKNYLVKIEDLIIEDELFTNHDDEYDYTEGVLDDIKLYHSKSYSESLVNSPGGKFWYVTMKVAQRIADDTGKSKTSVPIVWNWLFRSIGIDAVVSGTGIIHSNEPMQCVIFNPKAIKMVARLDNKHTERSIEIGKDKYEDYLKNVEDMKQLVATKTTDELVGWLSDRYQFAKWYQAIPTNIRHEILSNKPELLNIIPERKKIDIAYVAKIQQQSDDKPLSDLQ